MKIENIQSFIDRKIYQSLVDGHHPISIQNDLTVKCRNMQKTIESMDCNFNFQCMSIEDINTIEGNSRIKYLSFYVKMGKKRISDLDWVINKKKTIFNRYTNSQIFNLLKLKEKLQNGI